VDLETICHKCLQKDVRKRYASAAKLGDDLRRFTEGRPIAARPVGRLERLVRLCRREPVVAGLLAAVVLVLTAGVVVSSVPGVKALRSASLAQRKAEEAGEERERADEDAREAVRLAGKEKEAREAASRNEIQARENEKRANREKDQANKQRDRAELLVYAGKLAQAQLMWKDDKGAEALDLLDECQWNLRGWEHRHLWTLYNSNHVTFRGHTAQVNSVAWCPDGKRIFSGSGDFGHGRPGELKV
jgi:eukaryotic-like serine/threonine-protein kinase